MGCEIQGWFGSGGVVEFVDHMGIEIVVLLVEGYREWWRWWGVYVRYIVAHCVEGVFQEGVGGGWAGCV